MNFSQNISLAPIRKRFIAALIDYTLIFAFMSVYIDAFGEPNNEGGLHVSGVKALPINLAWFIITIGFEQMFSSTIGNGIMGLKPIHQDGKNKLSFSQSLKRHLLDPVDMFLLGLVGYLTMKNSSKNQRLGDQWAKTIVIDRKQN